MLYVVRSSERFLCATGSFFQFMAGETAKGTAIFLYLCVCLTHATRDPEERVCGKKLESCTGRGS